MNPKARMTVEEIAHRLNIGRLAVYAMLERGIIPAIRPGAPVDRHPTRIRAMGAHLRRAWRHWTSGATRGNGGQLMPVLKRRNPSGKVVWSYRFNAPGSTREKRTEVRESGFATKQAAIDAEAARRMEEQKKFEMAKAGAGVVAALPTTLAGLLREFLRQHVDEKLAPKTIERHHEQSAYLAPELLAMPLAEITPLHFNREWARLLKCGGHTRKSKTPRPLSAKTVRNIAGVVSSAFSRAIRWGLATVNPVTMSEPPVPKKHEGTALTPVQQELVFASAASPWCMRTFLEVASVLGCRRGELLALRWSDIVDGRAVVTRSLTQTRDGGLQFRGTKTNKPRTLKLLEPAPSSLAAHRLRQNEFKRKFGPDYEPGDLIFANSDGSPLRPDSVSAAVSLLFRRLKLPAGTSLHSLRHTHVSEMLDAGLPLPVVSARLVRSRVDPNDNGNLRAHDPWAGRRGGGEAGRVPEAERAREADWRCSVNSRPGQVGDQGCSIQVP